MYYLSSTRTTTTFHMSGLLRHTLYICSLFVLYLLSASAVSARNFSGVIRGVVRDQKGAILQGGNVEIKNPETGLVKSASTDAEGTYAFDSLPAGRYRISASRSGFETAVREGIVVGDGNEAVVDLTLNIARTETVVVVTAPAMIRPLVVETDPRAPRQPIPAHDGADYLKSIPGFSIIRKGGSDGDPVLRGMAGSRLNILLDGQQILGGCGGRMDPPTAYVFPAAYDRITVFKGPETVLYGANYSAGTVLFERDMKRAEHGGVFINSALTVGSYGRHDEMVDARAALPNGYVQAIATRSHTDDYRDGNGVLVHSFYTRWSGNAAFGWTPSENTDLEFSLAKSNGQAAYADRAMDGSRFARDNFSLKFDKRNLSPLVQRIEAQAYYNYIDHVMDNFSLRTPGMMFSAMNPDRQTMGGRTAATLAVTKRTTITAGVDVQRNIHRGRSSMGAANAQLATLAFQSAPRVEDMRFNQVGAFAEATQFLTRRSRLIGGFRSDWQSALDSRMCVNASMCPGSSAFKNDTKGATDRKTLSGGFGRYELDVKGGRGTFYAGLGHAARFPDYWERLRQDAVTLKSAFLSTRPERTTQFDTGVLWRSATWSGSVSGFYGKVDDYILIHWSPAPSVTRNVDAKTMGAEADASWYLLRNLRADAALAFVHADNLTDGRPLAQQPPIDGRLELTYDNHAFIFSGLARLVGRQDRIDIGSGNIVANGMDVGPTPGFAVFSFNGGFRLRRSLLITAGVDNIFDRAYAEHLSKSGAMVPGFVQTGRIYEPGRTFWLKAGFNLD